MYADTLKITQNFRLKTVHIHYFMQLTHLYTSLHISTHLYTSLHNSTHIYIHISTHLYTTLHISTYTSLHMCTDTSLTDNSTCDWSWPAAVAGVEGSPVNGS